MFTLHSSDKSKSLDLEVACATKSNFDYAFNKESLELDLFMGVRIVNSNLENESLLTINFEVNDDIDRCYINDYIVRSDDDIY